jgi:hypothetical protein
LTVAQLYDVAYVITRADHVVDLWSSRKRRDDREAGTILGLHLRLMEDEGWENFEACLRTPSGRFLPGGYDTSSCPSSFRTERGFASAKELIGWWSATSCSGFGQRFMCWVSKNYATGEVH